MSKMNYRPRRETKPVRKFKKCWPKRITSLIDVALGQRVKRLRVHGQGPPNQWNGH